MPSPYRIEGFAIVSADGMLADADGVMPPALFIDGDQAFFERGLDQTVAVIHGRNSQEQQPRSAERPRLVATRGVETLTPDPSNPKARLWNPATTPFEEGLRALGVTSGAIGIIGGTDIFGLFLPRYDLFHLSRAGDVRLPGGRPVFPQVPAQSAEDILRKSGLEPGPAHVFDRDRDASVVTWRRTLAHGHPRKRNHVTIRQNRTKLQSISDSVTRAGGVEADPPLFLPRGVSNLRGGEGRPFFMAPPGAR